MRTPHYENAVAIRLEVAGVPGETCRPHTFFCNGHGVGMGIRKTTMRGSFLALLETQPQGQD